MRPRQLNTFARRINAGLTAFAVLVACTLATLPASAQNQGPVRLSLDDAIQLAIQHNHNQIALQTTIQQSEAEEVTQGLRPNPNVVTDWEYLPLGAPSSRIFRLSRMIPIDDHRIITPIPTDNAGSIQR